MSNNLTSLVGKVILAWGGLDQQVYLTIQGLARSSLNAFPPESRFKHRMGQFRLLCIELSGGDASFLSEFDRFRTGLMGLEERRGTIAHGWAGPREDGVEFFDYPNQIKGAETTPPPSTYFSFFDLAKLEADIHGAKAEIQRLHAECGQRYRERENQPTD